MSEKNTRPAGSYRPMRSARHLPQFVPSTESQTGLFGVQSSQWAGIPAFAPAPTDKTFRLGERERVPKVGMLRDQASRIRSLSRDEYAKLLQELPEHLRGMVRFSVATGLRQGNVTRLQWKQISLERRHLWISGAEHKNGRPHAVPLNDLAMGVLLDRQGDHLTHVFTYEGKPIVQVNTKAWRNALVRAGIEDFRWHDLRHTFATWHREAGTPTHELQRLGGWKTQSMVERYAHVAPEGLQLAANRLDILILGNLSPSRSA